MASAQIPWFQRKFSFDFPAGLYPSVIMRVQGTPARIEEIVDDLPAEAVTQRSDGKWSIQENVGHLLDLEPLWYRRLEDYLSERAVLCSADLTNLRTDSADHNSLPLGLLLMGFRSARQRLVDRLHRLDGDILGRKALHPRLGAPMRLVDLLYFVAEHDDHHLARIWELRAARERK